MVGKIKQFIKNEFFRNFLTLTAGNTIAQAIGVLSIPILTRLYSPEEFGQVALFISIVSVIAIAANGRYDMAVVLPKSDGQSFHLMVGSVGIAAVFSIVTLVILVFFHTNITSLFESASFSGIVWLLPVMVFLLGTHKSMQYWFTRKREYRIIARNRVALSSTQNAVKLGRALFSNGYWGLIVGTFIGELVSLIHYVSVFFRTDAWRLKFLSFKTMIKAFREYSNFPKFLLPMGVVNSFSVNILVFALSAIASSAMVGFYERAWRVVNLPLSLLSTSFGNVFFERMTKTTNPRRFYLQSYFANLALAAVIMIPIVFWGETIFVFVLGNDWKVAGTIARVIAPLTVLNYATACVSSVFSVYQKNQILLIWQVFYLLIVLGWILFARSIEIFTLIRVFALIGATLYALLAFIGFKLVSIRIVVS